MRHYDNPIITSHRLARLTAWAKLWLFWMVGLCRKLGVDPALSALEPWMPLARMRRQVRNLVFLHAFMRVPAPRGCRRYQQWASKGRGLSRAVFGSRLRRAVRGAGLVELIALLHAPEAAIAKLARRLRNGLTRRRRVTSFATPVAAPAARPPRMAHADTS